MVFELMIDRGVMTGGVYLIRRIFSISRILISVYFFAFKRNIWSITAKGFSAFIISENIVSILNGSIYINYAIGSITTVGLCFVCAYYLRKHPSYFLEASILFFGFVSIIDALQRYIMPGGFFGATYKESAVYLLGSKNTCFFFYGVYIYFLLYKESLCRKRISYTTMGILFFLTGATIISDAANAFVMMSIIILYYIISRIGKSINKLFNLKFLIPIVAVLSVFVLSPTLRNIFSPFLNAIGRDSTVTGRDLLWLQAIDKFKNHPLIGNGILTDYILGTGVIADHAHSHYLDLLAKYGLITFLCFVITVGCVVRAIVRKNKKNIRLLALDFVIIGTFLLHSIVDHLELFNFIIILVSSELLSGINENTFKHKDTSINIESKNMLNNSL